MVAALAQRRYYSLIAILDFSLCEALGLPCLWQMLSYVHELSYKPMICSSPSSPLKSCLHMVAMIKSLEKNFVPALVALCSKKTMSAHYYDNYNLSMGKVHLIYETRPFKGCLNMVARQHARACNKGRKLNTLWYALCGKTMSRYYLLRWIKEWICSKRPITMRYREGLAMSGVSNLTAL